MTLEKKYRWKQRAKEFQMVGSRVTCDPPPEDTDEDWLVLDLDHKVFDLLERTSAHRCLGDYDDDSNDLLTSDMSAFRIDEVNIICMHNQEQYDRFLLATRLAKQFNLLEKKDRVDLFNAVRYGFYNE